MADQRIEIEVVMDDGSIKKAFGTIRKEAKETSDDMTKAFDAFNPIKILGIEAGINLFEKFIDTTKKLVQETINLSLEAEKVRAVNAQFSALTQQNTIATEQFSKAIEKSVAGLIDDEDALQLANNAMIRLGVTAQRLPEIFELARKASASGFGSIADNVEAVIQAIQTGNVRQLRSIGVTVEITKAQQEFAKSVGLTVDQLNEQQRAFVNSNEIIKELRNSFNNVDTNVRSFSDSLARFKVASADAFERFAVSFDKAFGPAIKGILDGLTESLNGNGAKLKANKIAVEDLGAEITRLQNKLNELNQKLVTARTDIQFNNLNRQIVQTSELLKAVKDRQEEYNKSLTQADAGKKTEEAVRNSIKLTAEQREQAYMRRLQMEQSLAQTSLTFQNQELTAREQMLQYISSQDEMEAERRALFEARKTQILEQGEAQRLMIATNYSNAKGYTEAQRDALREQQAEATNAQILNAEKAYQVQSQGAWGAYVQKAKSTLADLSNYTKTVLVQGMTTSLSSIGGALARGENAWVAFRNSFLGILGDIAIQMGSMFIAMGIANQAIPIFGNISGAMAILAGSALVVLGGALKAFGGGGSAGAMAGGGGSIGQGTAGDTGTTFTASTPLQAPVRTEPNTVVNFTVQGDILDSDSTQSRIVALLNDAIDTKGAVVRGLA